MTQLTRRIRRVVPGSALLSGPHGRTLVVTLLPADEHGPTMIEVREKGRRTGYRVSIGSLYVILATRDVEARRGKRKTVKRWRSLL